MDVQLTADITLRLRTYDLRDMRSAALHRFKDGLELEATGHGVTRSQNAGELLIFVGIVGANFDFNRLQRYFF